MTTRIREHEKRGDHYLAYQGFTNRETWIAHLWLSDPDDSNHINWVSRAVDIYQSFQSFNNGKFNGNCGISTLICLASEMEQWCKNTIIESFHQIGDSMLMSDLLDCAFYRVNWSEIAQAILDSPQYDR